MNALAIVQPETPADNLVPLPVRKRAPQAAQRFKVVEYQNPRTSSTSWRVSGSKRDGERIRENFKDEPSARARQIELETEFLRGHAETTIRATKLTAEQVQLCEVAVIKLGDDWHRILDAVDRWRASGAKHTPTDCPRIDDALAQFNLWLESPACDMRDLSRNNLRVRLNIFANSVQNVKVSEVSPEFIEAFLDKRKVSAATRDNDRRAISRFFSWCLERPRRWIATNPAREVRVAKGEKAPPQILTVKQCKALLRAAEQRRDGMLVPFVVACMFSGLRPFEASRLTWENVNLADGEIRLESTMTKTGKPRVVAIDATLAKWLKAYKGREFFPSGWRKNFDKVKLAAGLEKWEPDLLRHTAISHFFRQSGSYGLTAEQFGNSEQIVKQHYQSRVSSEETKKFYALAPKKGAK